ncbi:MAG: DUF935 domain-containing protein [Bacteroidales bacterium]|jgi:hypothetical protein|nr:DUF935 domain-containing protein [Bacteroidales bacterium]
MASVKRQNSKKAARRESIEIYSLTVASVDRSMKTLASWRNALRAAESPTNPNRRQLYDLYSEMELDTHVASVREKRILNVLSSEIVFFDRGGKENDAITQLIAQPFFRDMCADILDCRSWGFSLLYFDTLTLDPDAQSKYILVPRRNVLPEFGLIVRQPGDTTGIEYTAPPYGNYTIAAGDPLDLGLLNKAAPYVIYKKNTSQDWATYNEVYGFPFRKFTYSGNDANVRRELERAARESYRAAFAILPEEAQMEFIQIQQGNSGYELFSTFMSICDKQVSKLYLGNTMTTDAEGGNYKGEVHEKAEIRIADSDRHFLLSVLNTDFIRIMETFGIPARGGWFAFNDTEELPMKERFAIDMQLAAIVPIDPDYFYETYNIPKPKAKTDDEPVRKEPDKPAPDSPSPSSQKSPASPDKTPSGFAALVNLLKGFFAKAPQRGA